MQERRYIMNIREIIPEDGAHVRTVDSVYKAANIMRERKVLSLAVFDGVRAAGIITVNDLAQAFASLGDGRDAVSVERIMTTEPKTCSCSLNPVSALKHMREMNVTRAIVTDPSGAIIGSITADELGAAIAAI